MLALGRKLEMREDSVSERRRPPSMSYSSKAKPDWARLETYAAGACSTALRAPMPPAATPRVPNLQSSSDRKLPTSRPRGWRGGGEEAVLGVKNFSPTRARTSQGKSLLRVVVPSNRTSSRARAFMTRRSKRDSHHCWVPIVAPRSLMLPSRTQNQPSKS